MGGALRGAGLEEGHGYLGGALTGSVSLPVEVLAASFAGLPIVGGFNRALQIDSGP